MSWIQRFLVSILPESWAADMQAQSQAWRIRCLKCDASRSVWDCGGIRWKAASIGKRTLVRCSHCGDLQMAAIEYAPESTVSAGS